MADALLKDTDKKFGWKT